MNFIKYFNRIKNGYVLQFFSENTEGKHTEREWSGAMQHGVDQNNKAEHLNSFSILSFSKLVR